MRHVVKGINVIDTSFFSARLREERKRLKLTQAHAAERCAVTRETWSRYETGALSPGIDALAGFSAAGADVQYILTGKRSAPTGEPLSAETTDERSLVTIFRRMAPSLQSALLTLMGGIGGPPQGGATQHFNGPVGSAVQGTLHHVGDVHVGAPERPVRRRK